MKLPKFVVLNDEGELLHHGDVLQEAQIAAKDQAQDLASMSSGRGVAIGVYQLMWVAASKTVVELDAAK